MRIVRFSRVGHAPTFGVEDEDDVVVFAGDPLIHGFDTTGERVPLDEVGSLVPVIPRSKVVIVRSSGVSIVPNTAVAGPSGTVVVPSRRSVSANSPVSASLPSVSLVDDETDALTVSAGVGLVVGRVAKDIPADRWQDVLFGATVVASYRLTASTPASASTAASTSQSSSIFGGLGTLDGVDGFCRMGPIIETEFGVDGAGASVAVLVGAAPAPGTAESASSEVLDEADRGGVDAAADVSADSMARAVADVSHWFTLLPGDVVAVMAEGSEVVVSPGASVRVSIDGIGAVENTVVAR